MKIFLSFLVDCVLYISFYSFLMLGLIFFLSFCIIHAFLYLPLLGFIVGVLSLYIALQTKEILD